MKLYASTSAYREHVKLYASTSAYREHVKGTALFPTSKGCVLADECKLIIIRMRGCRDASMCELTSVLVQCEVPRTENAVGTVHGRL